MRSLENNIFVFFAPFASVNLCHEEVVFFLNGQKIGMKKKRSSTKKKSSIIFKLLASSLNIS
jgi:hypothetical protein